MRWRTKASHGYWWRAARAWRHPLSPQASSTKCGSLRGRDAIGADGVAALDALPLSAITQSPLFAQRASETLQSDTLTIYERI